MTDDKPKGLVLSPREMESLALAWQCFVTEPQIDMVKFAKLTGYTNASASVTLGRIKRKLREHAAGVESSDPTPRGAGTPKTPRKRATKGMTDESPTKKRRTPSKKAAAAAAQNDDDDEFNLLKVKKEEVAEVNNGADAFYSQVAKYAAGAHEEEDEDLDDGI